MKKPRPGTRVRPNKKSQQAAQSICDEKNPQESEELAQEEPEKVEQTPETESEDAENIKDSWDATSSEDESTEEPTKPASTVTPSKRSAQQQKSESSNDSGDESSSEEDDDSDGSEAESEAEETRTDAEIKREKAWQRIMVGRHVAHLKKTLILIWIIFLRRNVDMQPNRRKRPKTYERLLFVYWAMSIRVKRKFLINCDEQTFKMVKLVELHNKLVLQMYQSMQSRSNAKSFVA